MLKKNEAKELEGFLEDPESAGTQEWLDNIEKTILAGDSDLAMRLVSSAVDHGVTPDDIARGPMVNSMREVGAYFKNGEFFIPEVITASRALNAALFEIKKHLPESEREAPDPRMPTVMIVTVQGDFHDIGKNLAGSMFEARGYNVIDLGVDVPAADIVAAARERHPDVIGLSAMLTTTVDRLGEVIAALEDAGIRDDLEVYVSGVPVTQKLADEIGADKYCADLGDSLDYLEEFVLD